MADRVKMDANEFILKLMAGEKDFRGIILPFGLDLSAHEMYAELLSHLRVASPSFESEPVNVSGSDFTGLKAHSLVLPHLVADRHGDLLTVFESAELEGGDFQKGLFSYAVFSGAELENVNFNGSLFYSPRFDFAYVKGADFTDAPLIYCSREQTDFSVAKGIEFVDNGGDLPVFDSEPEKHPGADPIVIEDPLIPQRIPPAPELLLEEAVSEPVKVRGSGFKVPYLLAAAVTVLSAAYAAYHFSGEEELHAKVVEEKLVGEKVSDTALEPVLIEFPKKPTAKPFAELSDKEKRKTLAEIVKAVGFKFPVPTATDFAKQQALGLYENSTNFGSVRMHGTHNGVDVYGYGENIVAPADGTVLYLGRNIPQKSKTDHGNLIVLQHAVEGDYDVFSHYLHVGGIAPELKVGVKVKEGQLLAKVDCIGIGDSAGHLYEKGSRSCKRKAHVHHQIRVGYDSGEFSSHVNPILFYSAESTEKAKEGKGSLKGRLLSIDAKSLDGEVDSKKLDRKGSF